MRVGGAGARWQESKQNEKQQQQQLPEAYTLRADARYTSRLTPEPSALSVAGSSPSSCFASVTWIVLSLRSRFHVESSSLSYFIICFSSHLLLQSSVSNICISVYVSFLFVWNFLVSNRIRRNDESLSHTFTSYRADEVSSSEVVQQKLSQPASDAHTELPSSTSSSSTRRRHGCREEETFWALNFRSPFST